MITHESPPGTVPVTLFFDYNCPFCYVASHRLERLGENHSLDILWRFIEIRSGVASEGEALPNPGEEPGHSEEATTSLSRMIREDALPWHPRRVVANTRRALLLAQTVSLYRRERFLPLHRALFHASFAEDRNIGDPAVLEAIASEHQVDDLLNVAWGTSEPIKVFLSHVQAAQELELTAVPALVVSGRAFHGAVATDILEQALTQHHPAFDSL